MQSSRSVLLLGHDDMLLYTRREILEKASFAVWSATNLKNIETIASAQRIDLLIFCHTISPQERKQALAVARTFNSETASFSLTETFPTYGGKTSAGAKADQSGTHVKAKTFLDAVEEVMQRRKVAPAKK